MTAPIDNMLAKKIYKAIEDPGEVVKKIGSRLLKLEEIKIKKLVHIDINEEQDKDERDKADYERKKKFEKLTTDTVAMKEKMEKMQLAFRKA